MSLFPIVPAVAGIETDDPHWSNVVLLLDFEGSDGATSTTDESPTTPHTVTFVNNAQIDTGVTPPYGTSSCLFDGTNDQLTIPDNDDWNFGAGHYTVEAWVRPASFAKTGIIVGQWNSVNSTISWVLGVLTTKNAFFYTSTTGAASSVNFDLESTGAPLVANTWHHIAACYDGTKMRLFVDGVMVDDLTVSRTLPNGTFVLSIGLNSTDTENDFNGHIKGIRITKGVCRYDSDSSFTPPLGYPRA